MLRFSDLHARDDYRSATKSAREAHSQNQLVWWAADRSAAEYYGLTILRDAEQVPETTRVAYAANLTASKLADLPRVDLIVISKADAYDVYGDVENFANMNNFNLFVGYPAFRIFKRNE